MVTRRTRSLWRFYIDSKAFMKMTGASKQRAMVRRWLCVQSLVIMVLLPVYAKAAAEATPQAAEVVPAKQDAYHEVLDKLDALTKEEKELIRRGYREEHPLIRAIREQLRDLSLQKTELEKGEPAGAAVTKTALTVPSEKSNQDKVSPVITGRNMDSLDDKQKLAVGDRVSFRVVEDQEDPKPLTVTDAGELDVPELGLVPAAGKTCKQLAFEIKPRLEQTTYYRATVIVGIDLLNKTISGRRAYVSGQVQRTGPQEIPAGETWTVAKAIMRAGGF